MSSEYIFSLLHQEYARTTGWIRFTLEDEEILAWALSMGVITMPVAQLLSPIYAQKAEECDEQLQFDFMHEESVLGSELPLWWIVEAEELSSEFSAVA